MNNQTTTEAKIFNWKDHELDEIWHHGIQKMFSGYMDKFELLSYIEVKMESAIKREKKALLEACIEEIKSLEIRTDDGGEYVTDDTELMRTEAIEALAHSQEDREGK